MDTQPSILSSIQERSHHKITTDDDGPFDHTNFYGYVARFFEMETFEQDSKDLSLDNYKYDSESGIYTVGHPYRTYQAGWFVAPTCADVLSEVERTIPPSPDRSLTFSIVKGRDVSVLHLDCAPGTVIQLASQFNSLEMMNPYYTPAHGLDVYLNDRTQGPRAALCCLPSLAARNYNMIAERGGVQFNSLDLMGLQHKNGYLLWNKDSQPIYDIVKESHELIRIPTMAYAQVAGIDGKKIFRTDKLVHQIFSSAAPGTNYGNSPHLHPEINRFLLSSQYKGAIGMALLLHHHNPQTERAQLHLTLVGGGVFQVPKDVIMDSIKDALRHFQHYPIDIYLELYSDRDAIGVTTDF
jgi:hypothetical protein